MEPFEAVEAAHFLLSLTHREDQVGSFVLKQAKSLTDRLGGHPLGLRQAAAIINQKDCMFGEFLDEFDKQGTISLKSVGLGAELSKYLKSMDSMFELEKLDQDVQALLDVLSLLDPDGISEHILLEAAAGVELVGYPASTEAYESARTGLYARPLITRNKEERLLRIHRLTQHTARGRMSPTRFRAVASAATHLVSGAWPKTAMGDRHQIARWPQCEPLVPHIIQIYNHHKMHCETSEFFTSRQVAALLFSDTAW